MAGKLFSGSVVWITGASAGIGRALAHKFAEHGARVAISARRADRLAEAVRDIEAMGGDVTDARHRCVFRKDPRPKNLMWPTERAADVMLRAIYKRKREFVFTGHGKIGAFLGQHMPGLVHAAMVRGAARRALPRPSEA